MTQLNSAAVGEFDPQTISPDDEDEAALSEKKPLSDDQLLALIRGEVQNATGYQSSKLSADRRQAYQYYMADPYGDELDDRSKVVTTEVRDTIESILPQLMKIFASTDEIVKFEPEKFEDEQGAQQATDYCNLVFTKDNPGFLILYAWFKDALMLKNGVVKTFWDTEDEVTQETYTGLIEQQLTALLKDENVEIVAYTVREEQIPTAYDQFGAPANVQPMKVCDVTVKRHNKSGRVKIVPVPPDQFLISQRADSIQGARFVAHRDRKLASELLEMGFSKEQIEDLAGDTEAEYNLERIQRFVYESDTTPEPSPMDESVRHIWLTEAYLWADIDGDGIAERVKVLCGGSEYKILSKEIWDGDWPFQSLTPIPMPHKYFGLSVVDLVQDIQRIKSTLTRQMLDNIYGINNNRVFADPDRVNLDDLLTNRPGGVVRTKGDYIPTPFGPNPIGQIIMPMLEYVDTIGQKRTGVTDYNQGLDADSLNKTASGINQIMSAAQERVLLIARIFAETGVKDLFRAIFKLVCTHQNIPRMVRLRNKWVPVDPSEWNSNMDVTVDVALGSNSKQVMLQHLMMILQIQQQGLQVGLATPSNIYNTCSKLIENAGLKNADQYFTDPSQAQNQGQQQQPDPNAAKAQAQLQATQIKTASDEKIAAMKTQAEAQENQLDAQIEREKIAASLKETQMGLLSQHVLALAQPKPTSSAPATTAQKLKKPLALDIIRDPHTREMISIKPRYKPEAAAAE